VASRAAQLVSYKAASEVAGKLAILAALILCARRLSTADFAVLSLATTLGWMASLASDFGLHLFLGRTITRTSTPAAVLWPLFHVRVRTAIASLLVIGPMAAVLAPDGSWLAFMFVAAAPVLSSVAEFLNYAYRGLGRSELESGLSVVQRCGATLLIVGAALTVSALGALAASLVIARRILRAVPPVPQFPSSSVPHLSWRTWVTDVAPIGVGLVLSALYFRIDVFLLERWSGLDAVAHYSAVFRLVDAMRLLPAAGLTSGLTAFAVGVTLVAWPAAPWLVWVAYGAEYADAGPILQLLLLSFPLLTLNYCLTHLLIGWDQPRAYALCCLAALAGNLALNAWLIPASGAIGAAWATLGTEVVVTAMCLVALYRAHTSR
jgi:O-antigen/teichoic acid export membrane protein